MTEIKDAQTDIILKEIARREQLRVATQGLVIEDTAFPSQHKFVVDPSRYLFALCTRRAGKSNALGLRFWRTMQKHPGCFCPYIALTRDSARNIMWTILEEQNARFKLGAVLTESNLTATLPNGSRLQLFGADMKNFIDRLKGIKTPGAAIDEAQAFKPHIERLVDDVLGPAILDYPDGWLAITGTPGPIPMGFFYEVTEKRSGGYSAHTWSLFNNPYLPGAKDFVSDLKQRKGWPDDHPTLLREYYGQWILDLEALVIKYEAARNGFDLLPADSDGWSYIIGVDLGYNDADAIAIIGWNKKLRAAYLVEELVDVEQGISELANKISALIGRYNPDKVVMDTGGLGKKIAEEMRKRYSLPIVAAEKTRKIEYIEILNDALRTGKLMAKKDSVFAQDAKRLKWDFEKSTPDKLVVDDSFHSDIIDAVLYAFRESLHWLYEPEVPKIKINTPEWMKQQEEQHIERLEAELTRKDDEWQMPGWENE